MADDEKKPLPTDSRVGDVEVGSVLGPEGESNKFGLKHADYNDADLALQAIEGRDELVLTPEMEKKLLRKIDMNIMPLMCAVYMLNFLDKTTISYASVMGFKTSLNLVDDNYQWLGSMFYIGYLFWEYPTNRLLQRFPLGKYSAFNVIMWGLVLTCMAACTNFAGAVAVRFMLGVFEAAVTPGFALFTSQWYTVPEQATRTAIWFCFNGFAQILGGLVAYGIAKGVAAHPAAIEGWKIIFLLIGLVTSAVGVVFLFFMPDSQLNARFLTPEERIMAVERIRRNQQGVGNKHFKWYQLKEALTDPMTWALGFYALVADIPNGGLTNFFSLLIESFGFTAEQSLLYGCVNGAVEVVSLLVFAYMTAKWGRRLLCSSFWLVFSIIGIILVVALPEDWSTARLVTYYFTGAASVTFVALLSLISTNVAGYTKKTTVAAVMLMCYCVGNIIGPQTFRPSDAPRYVPAEITIIVCFTIALFDLGFIWWYLRRQNEKKAMLRAQPGYQKLEGQEFLDLTDRENPEFVYSY